MRSWSYCLAFLFALAVLPGIVSGIAAAADKPNVVLIFADDLGYGDLGCYGATKIQTPNIDRLAKEGRRFTDAHSASAVCSPSRYGLMTGRYPLRRNFWGPVSLRQGLTIDVDRLTMASLLNDAGYDTTCIGKWHLGFGGRQPDWNGELKPGPLELGFDSYFGIPSVNSGPPFVYVEDHRVVDFDPSDPFVYRETSATRKYPEKSGYGAIGGAKAAHDRYVDDQIATTLTHRAAQWLKQRDRDTPFFLYLATTNIHHPFTPDQSFVGTSQCGLYGDFVHELDWMVGELLETLDDMGVTDDTLVIFTSDNGGMFHVTGQKAWKAGHRMNGDLLGFKFGAWEGGHRVPMVARWPGKIPADSVSGNLVSHIDLIATLAKLIDRPLKEDEAEDSIDQWSSFATESEAPPRKTLVITPNSPKHLGLRKGKWVYIPARDSGGFQGKKVGDHLFSGAAALQHVGRSNSDVVGNRIRPDAPEAQLYDLESDPSQAHNVIRENPEVVSEMRSILQGYRDQIPATPRLGWINLKQ